MAGASTIMESWASYFERPITPAELYLYEHLMRQARTVEPTVLIEQFRLLFLEGRSVSSPGLVKSLEWIVNAPFANSEFKFILNRSYYIIINAWCESGRNRVFIPRLVEVMQPVIAMAGRGIKPMNASIVTSSNLLRQLLQQFVLSDQYQALQRLSRAVQAKISTQRVVTSSPQLLLETNIHRYPYVYEHNLLTPDSTLEQRQAIQVMRHTAQTQYDRHLCRYMAYRRSQQYSSERSNPTQNPTLLREKQLNFAIHNYTGKVDGSNTHRDLASQFLTYSRWTRSYGEFKQDLYGYLTDTMEPWLSGPHFGRKLSDRLQTTLTQYNDQPPTSALLQETCKSLLNFLVVDSPICPNHANFVDLLGNLGSTLTITVLLKLVLLCEQAKPWLERRFAILFNHYGDRPQQDVQWLVESMETLNVAMSTNFSLSGAAKL